MKVTAKSGQRVIELTPDDEAVLKRVEEAYGPDVLAELVSGYIAERGDHLKRQAVELLVEEAHHSDSTIGKQFVDLVKSAETQRGARVEKVRLEKEQEDAAAEAAKDGKKNGKNK